MLNNFVVYKFTSPSGKSYIGQTCNLKNRIRIHKTKNACRSISNAIEKYGFESFSLEILLENLSIDESNQWEEFYIREHQTLSPNGYNLATGGLNSRPCEETKAKISKSHKGLRLPQDAIERMKATKKGSKLSAEHKTKIGISQKGRISPMLGKNHSPETKEKMSIAGKNKVFSDTHRANLSLAQTGKKPKPESIEKTRMANLGRVHSAESRANMSAAQKGKKMAKESIEKTISATRKYYVVTNPLGESIEIHGLNRFCRENNLNATRMGLVAQKKIDNFKGWKCEYLIQEKAAMSNINAA